VVVATAAVVDVGTVEDDFEELPPQPPSATASASAPIRARARVRRMLRSLGMAFLLLEYWHVFPAGRVISVTSLKSRMQSQND
jgi:hypothetical protein